MYYVGAINRVGIEADIGDDDFYGQSYFVDPEGKFVGDVGDAYKPELIVRDLDMDKIKLVRDRWAFYRDRRPDAYGELVEALSATIDASDAAASPGGTVVSRDGAQRRRRPRSTARRSPPSWRPGQVERLGITADRTIDATGKYVVPGGVDVHTHMEMPFGGTKASRHVRDRHHRGGVGRHHHHRRLRRAEHRRQRPGRARLVARRRPTATAPSTTRFHQIIGGVDEESLKAMTYLVDNEGITSFKLFMAYPGVLYSDDGQILRAMQTANESGAMIMMHAENGIAIDVLVAQALARGETDPRYHSLTRPADLEGEATHRAIALAKVAGNVPLYIVHMSASEALEEVAAARHGGRTCSPRPARSTSTCRSRTSWPSPASRAPSGSARRRCAPSTSTTSADLWKGLRMNELAVVSTDHCPFCFKDQKEMGDRRLLQDPQRHRLGRAPHGAALPGRRQRRARRSSAGSRPVATTPARDVRAVPGEGVIAPGVGRRRRGSGTPTSTRRSASARSTTSTSTTRRGRGS